MADHGVDFAGDGMKDVSLSKSTIDPKEPSGGQGPIVMAGDGMKDTSKTFEPKTTSMPKGSGVQFAGDGAKDV